ncbi:fibronectin type III domain-containing protein [Lewinella sp. 4G2]|uniref:fibronectin type III domain-containing protein n=1 Tax=Lewinella sp. 4G2 TaxID=1803372 RepID=UPI0007B47025|nr:hypothetical protein [Lewinella sp. 4G2]OAV43834.1 hypothetical protein A3850_004665 [Lewinella sp. 4G2]
MPHLISYCLRVAILCLLPAFSWAQNAGAGLGTTGTAGYDLYSKVEDGVLYTRWEPRTLSELRHASKGMTVTVYAVSGPRRRPTSRVVETKKMEPIPFAEWSQDLLDQWDTVALATTIPEQMPDAFRQQTPYADEIRAQFDSAKSWIVPYFHTTALQSSWKRIDYAGMGYARTLDPNVWAYGIKVYPTSTGDTLYLDIDVENYVEPELPKLGVTWGDRQAKVKWRTLEYRPYYYGYRLQRSVAGGPFEDVAEDAYVNVLDTMAMDSTEDNLYVIDVLDIPNNQDSIVFRLTGYDHLGGESDGYREARGKGLSDIEVSPGFTRSEQTDSNYAILAWRFPEEQLPFVKEFRILHSPTQGKDYEIAMNSIPAEDTVTTIAFPMAFDANYYRIQAVSYSGREATSFEALVMSWDDTPPDMPTNFAGFVDSLGVSHLTWETTDEPDLDGYYLFKGYYRDGELQRQNQDAFPGPAVLDTTPLTQANDSVYYQLRAVDYRGNTSDFTPILALKKPDKFPPAPPRFIDADNDGKAISLKWVPSPAEDAESYVLYRREYDVEPDWTPVLEWTEAKFRRTYRDSLVEPGRTYEYTMLVTDDDGLVSDYPLSAVVKVKDYGLRPPIETLRATASAENKSVLIEWTYGSTPREYHIYKGVDDQPVSLLKVVAGDLNEFVDTDARKAGTYRYLMKAVFPGGKVSPYTEEVAVLQE